MASSAVVAPSLRVPSSAVSDPSSFSCSSSPFLASALPLGPLKGRSTASATVSARCSLSNEDQSSKGAARREILASIAAAGAALSVFSNASLAAIGPGGKGAERTAQKANDLLRAADKLNIEDAPKRFGLGIPGGLQDPGKLAQESGGSGAGAVQGAQQGASDVANKASEASGEIQKRTKNIFGQFVNNKGGAEKTAKETVGQVEKVKRNILGQIQGNKGGAESAARETVGQAQKNFGFGQGKSGQVESTAKDAIGQAKSIFGSFPGGQGKGQNAAKDAVGQAQKKASELTGSGPGVLESLKESVQGITENIKQ